MPVTDDDWAPLRDAVPSFREKWDETVARDWHDPADPTNVIDLAHHLVGHSLFKRPEELDSFFDALGALLQGASDDLQHALTVGLLEDIMHHAEAEGQGSTALVERLTRVALRHPLVREEWLTLLQYVTGKRWDDERGLIHTGPRPEPVGTLLAERGWAERERGAFIVRGLLVLGEIRPGDVLRQGVGQGTYFGGPIAAVGAAADDPRFKAIDVAVRCADAGELNQWEWWLAHPTSQYWQVVRPHA